MLCPPKLWLLNYGIKGKGKVKEGLNLHSIDCAGALNNTFKSKGSFYLLSCALKPLSLVILNGDSR
jgi:hypothetical protein